MRALPKNIQDSIAGLKSFYWCFEIDLISGDKLFFTSLDRVVNLSGIFYNPSSGLNVSEGIFNDSAQDHITLDGIYDNKGIDKSADLTNAKVKILIVMESCPYHVVTYYCTLYTKHDLHFTMFLEPESVKYNQTIVNVFSKTCRTKFGDEKCKIDKKLYSQDYTIVKMNIRSFEVSKIQHEAGFYIGGDVHFTGNVFRAKILNTMGNVVQLDRVIPDNVKQYKSVNLSAGCDKKFITCCNKFNNAVNFRGEPFIPEYNFLKINQ